MGAELYIVWPAFYTDVDDSRRLPRRDRLVVDLGGLYFNALTAVAVMVVWLVARVDALLLVVAAQLLLMLRQLPPVTRADGYHVLSDLVGVPDLFQHIKPTLAGMLPWNRRQPQPLRRWARWTVRAWELAVVPFLMSMFVLAVLLLPRLAATAWVGMQRQARAIAGASADADVLAMAAGVLKMLALVLPVAASIFMLSRVVRLPESPAQMICRLTRPWSSSIQATRCRPGWLVVMRHNHSAMPRARWVPLPPTGGSARPAARSKDGFTDPCHLGNVPDGPLAGG